MSDPAVESLRWSVRELGEILSAMPGGALAYPYELRLRAQLRELYELGAGFPVPARCHCPECGKPMRWEPRPDVTRCIRRDGVLVDVPMPAAVPVLSCPACGEYATDQSMSDEIEAALATPE